MDEYSVELVSITAKNLAELWQISYGPKADLAWKQWDGPYFKDPVVDWATFKNGWGKASLENPLRKVIVVEGHIVGIVTAYWEDGQLKRWLEVGIAIYNQTYWQKGIGTAALRSWISSLFARFLHLRRIGFTTWSGNIGMQKLGERLGMQQEARIRQVRFWQNHYFDSLKYGVLREEWQESINVMDVSIKKE